MEKNIIFSLKHSCTNAYFSKNHKDFIVRERPLYGFSGSGEHAIIYIQKKGLSTGDAIKILSSYTGLKQRDFSYAGLKDKQGLTFQHLCLLYKNLPLLEGFSHESLKILEVFRHENKLRIGHLKGNSFFIRLKKVNKIDALKIKSAFSTLCTQGFANYFGYQRFGKYGDNAAAGRDLLVKKLEGKQGFKKNKRLDDFLISAYQSELFNQYLSKRLEFSHFFKDFSKKEFIQIFPKANYKLLSQQKQFFKLLNGEILGHYPFGKCFSCDDVLVETLRFLEKDITPMGFLIGDKTLRSRDFAKSLEDGIYESANEFLPLLCGSYRPLISFISEGKCEYIEEKAHLSLEFFLQKGCYATTVLEELLGKRLREEKDENDK